MRHTTLVRAAACMALLGALTACGDDAETAAAEDSERIVVTPGDDEPHDHSTHDHGDDGHDHGDMGDMAAMTGDPDATPADELPDAQLREGEFALLDDAPDGSPEVSGSAYLARTDNGTTLSVDLSGLEADTEYMSHLHAEACSPNAGGDHFKFDPDGSDQPPNEVHLMVPTDDDGAAATTITNDNPASEGAKSMVLHLDDGTKFACADLS
ncbi:hypothetical protein KUV85_02830 [Nocardioides panacisoli]|uniref:hypothetical protein n=1 Tax=Nocardioides panacisoli TaxID=627624 RepID=UPI001C62FF88|nr:hypothetical protein [Nocardioides panacisoli]QYJ04631.1 hypothetical protein KUV85_02830 [Nocardioides panacisoli]